MTWSETRKPDFVFTRLYFSGYLVYSSQLNSNDTDTFNKRGESSSIKRLAERRALERISFDRLVRGNVSLGDLMEIEGEESIPSSTNRSPGTRMYKAGKYTAKQHRDDIDVIQVEVPRSDRLSNELRQAYAVKLAAAAAAFYRMHYGNI